MLPILLCWFHTKFPSLWLFELLLICLFLRNCNVALVSVIYENANNGRFAYTCFQQKWNWRAQFSGSSRILAETIGSTKSGKLKNSIRYMTSTYSILRCQNGYGQLTNQSCLLSYRSLKFSFIHFEHTRCYAAVDALLKLLHSTILTFLQPVFCIHS